MTERQDQQTPQNIDDYIALFPGEVQEILQQIRMTVRAAAPQAQEKIAYKMPAFDYKGQLVFFAAYQKHIGFYPAPTGVEEFKDALAAYGSGRGTLRFPYNQPIPYDLITRIVKYRLKENTEKAAASSL